MVLQIGTVVGFDEDTVGLTLPGLGLQRCFLWLCFICSNQGLGVVTSIRRPPRPFINHSQILWKFLKMNGSSQRLCWGMSGESSLSISASIFSSKLNLETVGGLQVLRGGLGACTGCPLACDKHPLAWQAEPFRVYPRFLPIEILSFLNIVGLLH